MGAQDQRVDGQGDLENEPFFVCKRDVTTTLLRSEDEKRYVDMTPAVFVLAAVAMAARYVSLGLDDQSLYILAGLGFALMYGLRPFFSKMQRPKD